ncbi:MAG: GNAT family N-acetyltransferase [bacterium]|nr:GNAT family N-acetyltransferase [bacterium]
MSEPQALEPVLRHLSPEDLDYLTQSMCGTLAEIGANAQDPQFQQLMPTYQEVCHAFSLDLLGRKQGIGWVAEVAGTPVGLIFGEPQPAWMPLSQVKKLGYIETIWVEPLYRQRGLARRLVEALEVAFKEAGVERVELNFHLNIPGAAAFWEKIGYRPGPQRNQKSLL